MLATEKLQRGEALPYCKDVSELGVINAKVLAEYAAQGDETALSAYEISAEMLGRGLAMIVDILNPERIVIGSVFARSEELFRPLMEKAIRREALGVSAEVCKVVPASLGEAIGDYAALSVAFEGEKNNL
jgi:glucokinase